MVGDEGVGVDARDRSVALRADELVMRGGERGLLGVRGVADGGDPTHVRGRRDVCGTDGVEEGHCGVDVVAEKVNTELAQGRDVGLDVDGVGVDEASHLCGGQQVARPNEALVRPFGRHVEHIRGVGNAVSRDECDVLGEVSGKGFRISDAEGVGVLVVEVDQILRDLLALMLVRLEQRRLSKATDGEVELPSEVVGIVHRGVHALGGLRGVSVTSIARDEDLEIVVVETRGDALSDLITAEPF